MILALSQRLKESFFVDAQHMIVLRLYHGHLGTVPPEDATSTG